LGAAVLVAALAPVSHASGIDLYDFGLSVSGGISGDWQDFPGTPDPTLLITPTSSIYNSANCCADASGGTTTGLGTFSYIFDPGVAGVYQVSFYLDYDVSSPQDNEYGVINNAGAAEAGITGEIFNALSATSNIQMFDITGPGGEVYGLADGTNHVPGQVSNDNDNSCTTGGPCDADVGAALTYLVTLTASQEAIFSASATTTDPGGFSLKLIHPIDKDNAVSSTVYVTGSDVIQSTVAPPPPGTPEPSTWFLSVSALAALVIYARRRDSRRQSHS
jgi:hypothetical protein